MNKRERFQNFLENKPVDRVPVGFWHHYAGFFDMDNGLTDPQAFENNVMGHVKSKEIFEPDIVKIMTDSLLTVPVDLSKVQKASDLYHIEPFALDSPYALKSIELASRVREFYTEDIPIFTTGFTPLFPLRRALTTGDLAHRDESKFFAFLAEDPEAVSAALGILGERIAEFHRILITQCGLDGIYLSVNNQNGAIADDIYRQYVTPHEKAVLADAKQHGRANLLHICGGFNRTNNMRLFQDYDASAINWAVNCEGMSLAEGKQFFHGKPVFGGFEQTGVLYKGTREEVEEATWKLLDEAGQIGIMMGADCTVPQDIDENRFEWVRQAATAYANK